MVINQPQNRKTPSLAEAAAVVQRRQSVVRQRNRLLGLMLAGVVLVVLIVAVTVTFAIHAAEAGHALADF